MQRYHATRTTTEDPIDDAIAQLRKPDFWFKVIVGLLAAYVLLVLFLSLGV